MSRRLSPQRLAKLANALGVSTPIPQSSNPAFDSQTPSIAANSPTRFLLHVIPPSHLPHSNTGDGDDDDPDLRAPTPSAPGYHKHFLRGTLLPVHPTLQAQLTAIAREYALPSTAGLVLYLINGSLDSDEPGPRLSDDIWKLLWSRVLFAERSPSPSPSPSPFIPSPTRLTLRPFACSPSADAPFSPSTPSSIRSNSASTLKSETLHSPGTPDTSIDLPPPSSSRLASAFRADTLDLPGLSSPSLIPILAKVEFDIDKRKATWYDPWLKNRLKKKHATALARTVNATTPLELLTVKRSELRKKDPLGLSPEPEFNPVVVCPRISESPSPIQLNQDLDAHSPEEELDEDATATFAQPILTNINNTIPNVNEHTHIENYTNTISDDLRDPIAPDDSHTKDPSTANDTVSTQEEEVLEMLEMMSKSKPKSRSSSSLGSQSSSSSSSGSPLDWARKMVLPPLAINTNTNADVNNSDIDSDANPNTNATREEDSYLAYTEPEVNESLVAIPSKSQGVKREFAVFDDFELELDPTLDIDENDPNDRRKSQIIMRAKLDEIEKTMAQLSPRTLPSDLSLSFSPSLSAEGGSPLRVSPISPKALGQDFLSPGTVSKDFVTSSPPRFGLGRHDGREAGEGGEGETEDLSGKSWPAIPFSMIQEKEATQIQPIENAPPPPPPPRLAVNGVSTLPPRVFPSAPTRPPPPPPLNGLHSGISTPMTETERRKRELEEEQGIYDVAVGRDLAPEGVIPLSPDPFGRHPSSSSPGHPQVFSMGNSGERDGVMETRARSGTMTMTTTSRFSADSGRGEEPLAASAAKIANATATNNRTTLMSVMTIKRLWRKSKDKDKEKILNEVAPPTPTLASSNTPATGSNVNDIDKSLPLIPPPPQRPERPSEEQLDLPDISMQAAAPPRLSPSPRPHQGVHAQTHNGDRTPPLSSSRPSLDYLNPPKEMTGRRSPQEQPMHPAPSRPSLDQLAIPPLQQQPHHPLGSGNGGGRRTPQDQFMFPPPRPSPDQLSPVLPASNHLPPPVLHRPHTQTHAHPNPMQMPMFQGRNPHKGPVTPVLAMHYPSRSISSSSVQQQPDKLDMDKLLFDQESRYPVRLASGVGAGGGTGKTGMSGVGMAAPPPPFPSVEPEKPITTAAAGPTTMRKSILKLKPGIANGNMNGNAHSVSDSSSSVSSSSSIGGAVLRQSFERSERPGGPAGHVRGVVGGGRRPSVIHFGSISSSASSTSISSSTMHRSVGGEVPPNPQVPAQYMSTTASSGDSKITSSNQTPHVSFKLPVPTPVAISTPNLVPNLIPSPALSIPNLTSKDRQVDGSRPPSSPSVDSQILSHSPIERRSAASSFDMTEFEFVSPVSAQGR